jgi:hypothetical protein
MGCNCNKTDMKRFQDINHVRILALQFVNTEKQDYAIFKKYFTQTDFCFDFAPLSEYKGKTVEILRFVPESSDVAVLENSGNAGHEIPVKTKRLPKTTEGGL